MVVSITSEFKMTKSIQIQIEADILLHKQKKAVEAAATELYNLMKSGQRNGLIGKIWPNLSEVTGIPILHLEPMNRLGGDQGRTGSTVLGGRFFSTPRYSEKKMLPSRPMVVKVSPEPGSLGASKSRKMLLDEYDAAENLRYQFDDPARFARPLHKYCSGERSPVVLWAPMASTMERYPPMNFKQRRTFAEVEPAVNFLSSASPYFYNSVRRQRLKSMIFAVKHLQEAHCVRGANHREDRNLFNHYGWELRDFNKRCIWTRPWKRLWGQKSCVSDFDDDWPNPVMICRTLRHMAPVSLRVGYIHGDLHPRNIIFEKNYSIRVIDFGWARPCKQDDPLQHIVKDFVLLEANLRFMTLPPFLPYDSVKDFLDWIGMDDSPPQGLHDEIKLRINLIRDLRETAKNHIGTDDNWDIEYIVPLFLVSLGLLKHCHSADCTWAARYNVLRLARYLVENNVV